MTISQFIKKLSTTFVGTASVALSGITAAQGISITPTNNGGNDLVDEILGSGITVVPDSINYIGTSAASGIFTNGLSSGIGIDSGIIITTGTATDAEGPNDSDEQTTENQLPGDSDLDGLIPGFTTEDATILEFDFQSQGGNLYFNYVFASEEYIEWSNNDYNDVFGFFLNGENIALIPGTSTPVAINTVNGGEPLGTDARNPEFFNNNDLTEGGPFFDIEYDGFTNLFTAQALGLSPGYHRIRLAIADAGDAKLDSAVFIQAKSFSDMPTDVSKSTVDVPKPKPKSNVDVPKSQSTVDVPKSQSQSTVDVPKSQSKSTVDVPKPKSNVDVPDSKSNVDVPDSKSTVDVPDSKSTVDVPEPSVLIGLLVVGFAGSLLKKKNQQS
ncbi:MAG: choice-of-anchor L domain-containing protein [Cyanobacteriota bacterium]|nr:choice-of-anchor L domain-containing protein [Cyanobacteriota bacterium]